MVVRRLVVVARRRMEVVDTVNVEDMVHLLIGSHRRPWVVGRLRRRDLSRVQANSCAWVRPARFGKLIDRLESSLGSYLQASATEYALVQHNGIVDQTWLSELHVRIPARAN